MQKLSLTLYDGQGAKQPIHPTIFLLSNKDVAHLPLDFNAPRCVLENTDQLYGYLAVSFNEWTNYRDQIIGKSSNLEHQEHQEQQNTSINHDEVQMIDARALFDLIVAPLEQGLQSILWIKVKKIIETHGVEIALHDVLSSLDAKQHWVWLQVDVRDHAEVEWQAKAIAKTLGLPEYINDGAFKDDHLADLLSLQAMSSFDLWLNQFEKSFILVESGDSYFGFVVANKEAGTAVDLLQKLGSEAQFMRQVSNDYAAAVSQALADAKANAESQGLMSSTPSSYPALNEKSIDAGVLFFKPESNEGQLKALMSQYAKAATEVGRVPLVCVSAAWCEPCQEMLVAMHHEDARSVMEQVALILIDIEDWGSELSSVNIEPSSVPLFHNVLENGCAGKISVDGDAWDDAVPSVIAGVLRVTFGLKK